MHVLGSADDGARGQEPKHRYKPAAKHASVQTIERTHVQSGVRPPGPPPSTRQCARALSVLSPLIRALRPKYYGFEALPGARPLMFVGNHQLLALDTPFLVAELWRRGLLVRPLVDDFMFALGPLAEVLTSLGVVHADPATASALLARGECILVYPGGSREATKGSGHPFKLEWWDRLGFAQIALRHRCPVVPVAAVGVDDAVRVLLGREQYLRGSIKRLVDRLGIRHDLLPPLVVPRRRPCPAFKLGSPITLDHFEGHDPESAARRLRVEVATAIEVELAWLLRRGG